MAIKCPSIDVQLCTFKKYQQAFSSRELLHQVTRDTEATEKLLDLFQGIWSLEDYGTPGASVNKVFEDALANPQNYVLKPQKEGGGNNFYNDDIPKQLLNFENDASLRSYLLMEKIKPPKIRCQMVRECALSSCNSLSELGIYSVIFTRNTPTGNEMLENKTIGTLLRTKNSTCDEGGVVAGASVVDSPFVLPAQVIAEKSAQCPAGSILGAV